MSAYDAVASSFDRYRLVPEGVTATIRAAIVDSIGASSRPRVLDLGAGTGRIGRAFVASGDDYFGVDLSIGMLREFIWTARDCGNSPRLVQADGRFLPFGDATFDAVILIQVFGGLRDWRPFLDEAQRILRTAGALIIGHSVVPANGVDAQMKQRLASLLSEMGVEPDQKNARAEAQHWLESTAKRGTRAVATAWNIDRTPREFLDRHRTGARFSVLPDRIKAEALDKLRAWAVTVFGSLDAVFSEQHAFELRVFTFQEEVGR